MQVIGYLNRSRQGGTGIPPFDTLRYSGSAKSVDEKDMPGKSLTDTTSPRARKPP